MPLIKNGRLAEEDWAFIEGDADLPDGKVTVTLARFKAEREALLGRNLPCLLYTSPSPRDQRGSRMPSSA